MCGRYVVAGRLDNEEFSERYHLRRIQIELPETFNAAPSQRLPVILEADERAARLMQWGLIPRWRKPGESNSFAPINARSESVLEKPMFRPLMNNRRCLVPASGFYEWQQRAGGGGKQPYYVTVPDQPLISFAGLYDEREEDGEGLTSYTILTTAANDLMATVHDRMPVILHPADEEEWLSRDVDNGHAVEHLLQPYPADEMVVNPVSRAVNNVRNNGPDLIEPMEE